MNYKIIILLAFTFLYTTVGFAQQNQIDSLKQVIAIAKQDTIKIQSLLNLGVQYEESVPDTAILYYQKALKLAEKINEQKFIAKCYNYLGIIYFLQSSYPKALEYYKKSLKINLKIGNKLGISMNIGNIGSSYYYQSNYPKASEYFQKALMISKEIGDKGGIASNLENIGLLYKAQSDYGNALKYYQKALKINQELDNKLKMVNNIGNIGSIYYYQSNYLKVLEYYNKALIISKEIGDKDGIASNLDNIGVAYMAQSDYGNALEYYKKALKINQELDNKLRMANNIGNIGSIYYYQSNYLKALECFQKALLIKKQLGNKSGIAAIIGNMGNVHKAQSNYFKALEFYNKALIIYKELGDKSGIASIITHIGAIYSDQGDYPKALEYFQKALLIKKQLGNKSGMATIIGNMGLVYKAQSDYNKALECFQKALLIKKQLGNKLGMAANIANIGLVYNAQSDYYRALEYYNKALKINQELGNKLGMAINLGNMGNIYTINSNYSMALEYYNKALKINNEIDHKYGVAINLGNMGTIFNIKMEYNKAIDYNKKALKINNEIGVVDNKPYKILSISYWSLNNYKKAANNLDTLLNINNKNIILNFSILSESVKEFYFAGVEEDYWRYNSFVLQNIDSFPNMVERVYNNTVKNKGLLLKSNTAMRNAIYASKDSTIMQDYDNWVVLKTQIAKKYSNGGDATILEHKADSLEGNLVKNSNEFSDFKKVQNIDWKQVQARLKENEVTIEFTHFPLLNPDSSYIDFTNQVQYVALIVTPNSQNPEMIPLFEEKQLEHIIGKFGGNNYSYINSIYGKNNEVNTELYNLIWAPIDSTLESIGVAQSNTDTKLKVYLSPDGLLHKISFSAIAKKQNVYLCDAYDIEVKSTTGKIIEQNHQMTQSHQMNTATLFGGITYDTDSTQQKVWNYLEGTKTETQEIDRILKKGNLKVNYYTNTSATEEEFKLMASNSNILHIATHGFFYPDPKEIQKETEKNIEVGDVVFRGGNRGFGVNSFVESYNPLMRSGLVFAGANDVWSKQNKNDTIDDGVLTAQEVANIDMRKTELVVMSACETGLGDIKGSEGVYGLQRAFKMAGVKYMIMSLWQVPDKETEEFMTTFYKKLIKQKDIKQAFADTQKEMRVKYDPYFWAAFVLIE